MTIHTVVLRLIMTKGEVSTAICARDTVVKVAPCFAVARAFGSITVPIEVTGALNGTSTSASSHTLRVELGISPIRAGQRGVIISSTAAGAAPAALRAVVGN